MEEEQANPVHVQVTLYCLTLQEMLISQRDRHGNELS